jgi:hypothetical protein
MIISARSGLYGIGYNDSGSVRFSIIEQDSLKENQILYNGKIWKNLYYMVKKDQFLFSNELLPGSITINGKTFNNINFRYDIYNDEIITPTNNGTILKLNKEMIDSFSILFQNKKYQFTAIRTDSVKGFNGYVNVLYKGKSALYVKYRKAIDLLAVDDKYDIFYQFHRIYIVKDGIVHQIAGKGDLFKVLNEAKVQLKDYMKKNRLKVSNKNPESFIPVIRFYDNISQ